MHKSDRLFQLTNLLRAHRPITAKNLAEKLAVSERTIYRYMDDLSLSGIPVYGEAGIGYRLSEGFELPPLQLTQLELEALIVSVDMLSSWTGPELGKASRALLSKIEAGLSNPTKLGVQKNIRVPGEHLRAIDFKHWDQLHKAINSQQWVHISYNSLANKASNRLIFPLGLFYWGGKWTLACWCSLKEQYRDFSVDRIGSIASAVAPTVIPDTVNLTNCINYQRNQSLQYATDTMVSGG